MPGIDEPDVVSATYAATYEPPSLMGVCGLVNGETPDFYVTAFNINWWIADDDNGLPCLFVTNVGSWEHAIHATDVENWEGTPWEDIDVTDDVIKARFNTLDAVFKSLR